MDGKRLRKDEEKEENRISLQMYSTGLPDGSVVKNLPTVGETWVRWLGWEDPLEKGKTAHSSILAWSQIRLSDFHSRYFSASLMEDGPLCSLPKSHLLGSVTQ